MGLPPDPRWAGRPGSEDSGVDGAGNPEECRNRPRAVTDRAYLVAVSALPGRGDPGAAFFTADLAPAENLIHAGGSRCMGETDVVRDGGRWGARTTGERCGMVIDRAAATGLSRCDERVRVAATTADAQRGQRRGDPRAAPPALGPAAAARSGKGAVHPG